MQVHEAEKLIGNLIHKWQTTYPKAQADAPKWILPPLSCQFLQELYSMQPEPRSAFEFGSGRSTHALRRVGGSVTSVEDSQEWLIKTEEQEEGIPKRSGDVTHVVPLTRRWLSARPIESFDVQSNHNLVPALRASSLILVDSPPNPAKREHTLWTALHHAPVGAVVVIDDLNVAATARYANRIANQNHTRLRYWQLSIDHTLGIYFKRKVGATISLAHPREFVGTWLRA